MSKNYQKTAKNVEKQPKQSKKCRKTIKIVEKPT